MEYTVPEVSQSLIITRLEGRTPVPAREQLEALPAIKPRWRFTCRCNVFTGWRSGWWRAATRDHPGRGDLRPRPESQTVRGTLADIGDKVRDAGIRKTALIPVGPFLGDEYHYSKLYAADFSHEYRKA